MKHRRGARRRQHVQPRVLRDLHGRFARVGRPPLLHLERHRRQGSHGLAPNTVWDGTWHHVAGTYDGAAVRFYVDGAQVGTGTPASGPIVYGLAASTRHDRQLCRQSACAARVRREHLARRRHRRGADLQPRAEHDGARRGHHRHRPRPASDRRRWRRAPRRWHGPNRRPRRRRHPGRERPLPRHGRPAAGGRRRRRDRRCLRGAALRRAGARVRPAVATSLVDGEVLVRLTPSSAPVPLAGVASLPVGAIVDARKGRLDLRTAGRRAAASRRGSRPGSSRSSSAARAAAGRPTDLVLRTPPGLARACAAAKAPPQGRRAPPHRGGRASSVPSAPPPRPRAAAAPAGRSPTVATAP